MKHNYFPPISHRADLLGVAPFLRNFKGRGYRRRAVKRERVSL